MPYPKKFRQTSISETTRDIWLNLQQRYQCKNRPQIFQLRREISNLVRDQNSVTAYFAKLKTLSNEFSSYRPKCSCGRCNCGGMKQLVEYFQTEYVTDVSYGSQWNFLSNSYSTPHEVRTFYSEGFFLSYTGS